MEMLSSQDQVRAYEDLFRQMIQPDEAGIFAASVGNNQNARYLTIDLSTAKLSTQPYVISFPFRSFVVLSTTDSSVSVNMRLATDDSSNDSFPVKNNYSLMLPFPVQKAFLDWSAQSSKSISILFLLRGDFRSNQLVSSVAANVSVIEGSAVSTQAGAQVTTTAASLFAADSTRIMMVIQNQSGQSIWIGSSSSITASGGATPGIEIAAGGYYEWKSIAQCFAICSGANTAATAISLTKFS